MPRVIFVPAASGAPVAAALQAWSDTSITFTAPRTPYQGGGWLVVMVDGVASEGLWTMLAPAAQGSACGFDTECAAGHCVDGVCCDQECSEGCRSCLGSANGVGTDGTCGSIAAEGQPRFGCDVTDDVCSSNGRCDGAGSCSYPPAGTSCEDPPSGTCIKGTCIGPCTSNLDCAAGLVCWPNGRCEPGGDPGPDAPGCGCRAARDARGGGELAAILAMLAILTARRRRAQNP